MLQKNPSLQCTVCGTQFGGLTQFNIYCCKSCGRQHIICPTCATAIPPCPSCNGCLLPNDIYIEKYGIKIKEGFIPPLDYIKSVDILIKEMDYEKEYLCRNGGSGNRFCFL